ncbi:hypothetical protein SUGI_0453330 [Cryptomeria japonica]|nr:hypothetical protein SUGI_0453330 [Cryptomeria japonica]
MSSSPTSIHQTEAKLSANCWAALPVSLTFLWRPKRTISPSKHRLCPRPAHINLTTSSKLNIHLGIRSSRNIQYWSCSRLRIRPHGQRGVVAELDWKQENLLSEVQYESQNFRIGPLPGDLAEVEGFCRIFRVAEQLRSAIMNVLCNPDTGECSITYLSGSDDLITSDVPILEEKVVSGLACMGTLLHRGRQDILAGRHSSMSSFHVTDKNMDDDKLPPLAIFRAEMKQCCAKLQTALECYFLSTDQQNSDVWRRLQRLKNVCYDAGYPRSEGAPCHTVLPNWSAVNLYPGRTGRARDTEEVAFWRGGQVTEEGLKWLLDKGYKVIVDLRAESVEDKQYQAAIKMAVSSGKVQLVHFPVEVGTAPTREQVEQFAALVLNNKNEPLYLHSQEGVWRTSAMVSRWRELISSSHFGSTSLSKVDGMLPPLLLNHVDKDFDCKDWIRSLDPQDPKLKHGLNSLTSENGSVFKVEDKNSTLHETVQPESSLCFDNSMGQDGMQMMSHSFDLNNKQKLKQGKDEEQNVLNQQKLYLGCDPFKAQIPQCNFLLKREMSEFFKNRKKSPKAFFESGRKRFKISSESINSDIKVDVENQNNGIAGAAGRWGLAKLEISNAASSCIDHSSPSPGVRSMEEHTYDDNNLISIDKGTSGTQGINANKSDNGSIGGDRSFLEQNKSLVRLSSDSPPEDNDDLEPVSGNMCASATGVVRVQSRKKAEMYLVRTDGFSCAREKVKESSLAFTHPSTQQQMLMWKTPPKTVLLLKKLGQELMEEAKQVASFLYHQERMNVVVEPELHDIFARVPGFGFIQTFYNQDIGNLHERVDFVACLGGDGVILHASNLFRHAVPPIVSFNLGSLGFLTAHPFKDFKTDLKAVIHGNNTTDGVYITLRMRLRCEIFRHGKAMQGKVFDVLNEIVVDRGSNPYLCKIECYEHNRLITKVQADGVIVATPTGSTAYSTSAGGSMVHPNVPCMLFTPICPHSLSFRPVILPDSSQLELKIPENARNNAWVSFDGKRRQQLSKGDSVRISMSEHPLPTVNKSDQTSDWFMSLVRCLNWNERLEQKVLTV